MDQVVSPIGPHGSVERPVRCIFCGAISAWWACGCKWSRLIEDGKLPRPRTVMRDGVPVIVLCDELREAARRAGVIMGEYRRDAKGGDAQKHGVESETVKGEMRETAAEAVSSEISVSENVSCEVCGKPLGLGRAGRRYCSGACRLKAHRR